jgi:hypothetical protein
MLRCARWGSAQDDLIILRPLAVVERDRAAMGEGYAEPAGLGPTPVLGIDRALTGRADAASALRLALSKVFGVLLPSDSLLTLHEVVFSTAPTLLITVPPIICTFAGHPAAGKSALAAMILTVCRPLLLRECSHGPPSKTALISTTHR